MSLPGSLRVWAIILVSHPATAATGRMSGLQRWSGVRVARGPGTGLEDHQGDDDREADELEPGHEEQALSEAPGGNRCGAVGLEELGSSLGARSQVERTGDRTETPERDWRRRREASRREGGIVAARPDGVPAGYSTRVPTAPRRPGRPRHHRTRRPSGAALGSSQAARRRPARSGRASARRAGGRYAWRWGAGQTRRPP